MSYLFPLQSLNGAETMELIVFAEGEAPQRAHVAQDSHYTVIAPRTIRDLRDEHGGDVFEVSNPSTGRRHQVSLQPFDQVDPSTTYVEIRFHFTPSPFASEEAQTLQQRARNELRRLHEMIVNIHDDPELEERFNARRSPDQLRTKEHLAGITRQQIETVTSFARRIGLLTSEDISVINNDFAKRRPDLFRPYQ